MPIRKLLLLVTMLGISIASLFIHAELHGATEEEKTSGWRGDGTGDPEAGSPDIGAVDMK